MMMQRINRQHSSALKRSIRLTNIFPNCMRVVLYLNPCRTAAGEALPLRLPKPTEQSIRTTARRSHRVSPIQAYWKCSLSHPTLSQLATVAGLTLSTSSLMAMSCTAIFLCQSQCLRTSSLLSLLESSPTRIFTDVFSLFGIDPRLRYPSARVRRSPAANRVSAAQPPFGVGP